MPTQTTRLNIAKPDQGNVNWKNGEDQFKDKVDQMAINHLSIPIYGQAVDEEIVFDGFKFEEAVDITGVALFAREAPAGAALTVDFLKDGAEQTKIATLADGATKQKSSIAGLSYGTLEDLGLKIKSVGTTDPGNGVTAVVHYNVKPIV